MAKVNSVRSRLVLAISGVVLVLGLYVIIPHHVTSTTTVNNQSQTSEITYQGVDGQDALSLLKASHHVETTSSSYGEFVNSIDDVTPDSGHFWSFYVNGQLSDVGAGSYVTKSSDQITWKLDAIQ